MDGVSSQWSRSNQTAKEGIRTKGAASEGRAYNSSNRLFTEKRENRSLAGRGLETTAATNNRGTGGSWRGGKKMSSKGRQKKGKRMGEEGDGEDDQEVEYVDLYGDRRPGAQSFKDDAEGSQDGELDHDGNQNQKTNQRAASLGNSNRSSGLSFGGGDNEDTEGGFTNSRVRSQIFDQQMNVYDIEYLKNKSIDPESVVQYWPHYFNEHSPNFNQKSGTQALAVTMLASVIKDTEAQKCTYLSWQRKRGDGGPIDAVISLEDYDRSGINTNLPRMFQSLSALKEFPTQVIGCLGVAMHIYNTAYLKNQESQVFVRLIKLESAIDQCRFPELTSAKIKKFVLIKGRITLLNTPRLLVHSVPFSCQECGRTFIRYFTNNMYSVPTKCENPDCSSKTFTMDRPKSKVSAIQRFVVQETGSSVGDKERFMGLVNCEGSETLLGQLKLNKVALLAGIWKTEPSLKTGAKAIFTKGLYDHFLDVNSIEYLEEEGVSALSDSKRLSFKDSVKSKSLCPHLERCSLSFYFLVGSLCPNIPGQEFAKACIILSLVGATNPRNLFASNADTDSYLEGNFKDNIHLLLLGERGVGKQELLKYVEALNPKSNLTR